jgi:hypothetical protein
MAWLDNARQYKLERSRCWMHSRQENRMAKGDSRDRLFADRNECSKGGPRGSFHAVDVHNLLLNSFEVTRQPCMTSSLPNSPQSCRSMFIISTQTTLPGRFRKQDHVT